MFSKAVSDSEARETHKHYQKVEFQFL